MSQQEIIVGALQSHDKVILCKVGFYSESKLLVSRYHFCQLVRLRHKT